ncbi:MAG: response regulator transcription factor [Acidimicrobiia bacterium]|nr:response regulator transcription factor [Acidimicrobiia bacterium]
MSRPRVLVVEDERIVSFLLTRTLEAAGYSVTAVDDGLDALEVGMTEDFDLVLLDQRMPGLLGLEVLQRWKAAGRPFPVIMVSGITGEADVIQALEVGAVDYIRKPFSVQEVVARVKVRLLGVGP